MARADERVTVVWRDSDQAETLNVLTYRPEGTVRTWPRNAVDGRVRVDGEALTVREAIDFLRAGDGKHLLVPVAVAKQLGGPTWEFDMG